MIKLLAAGAALLGDGHWQCTYQYEHPQDNIKEVFVSNVRYADDLSYASAHKIIYSNLKDNKVFAQFSYDSKGVAHVSGNTFYLHGYAFNVRKDFDHSNSFPESYTTFLIDYLNTETAPEDKTLTVVEHNDGKMVIKHEKTGTFTHCKALPK